MNDNDLTWNFYPVVEGRQYVVLIYPLKHQHAFREFCKIYRLSMATPGKRGAELDPQGVPYRRAYECVETQVKEKLSSFQARVKGS